MNGAKNKLQEEALAEWMKTRRGTCVMPTGTGKNFLALKALKNLPDKLKVLHLSEETGRRDTFEDEIKKFKKLFGYNAHLHDITYACYQSAYKWENTHWDMVIADEVHSSLTDKYSEFFYNNKYDRIMGLTATPDLTSFVDEEETITKGQILAEICPIVYSCTAHRARAMGALPKIRILALLHELDEENKNIEGGSKKKPFMTTERSHYDYWSQRLTNAFFMPDGDAKKGAINLAMSRRSNLLYALPSKVPLAKQVLNHIQGKTIVFANSLDMLANFDFDTVSSRNKDDKNKRIKNKFNSGKIDIIGSFKKLQQGVNLSDLDNVFMISYYSKNLSFVQRSGRIRGSNDEDFIGDIIAIVTKRTKEEDWFRKMIDSSPVIWCNGFDDFKRKY